MCPTSEVRPTAFCLNVPVLCCTRLVSSTNLRGEWFRGGLSYRLNESILCSKSNEEKPSKNALIWLAWGWKAGNLCSILENVVRIRTEAHLGRKRRTQGIVISR